MTQSGDLPTTGNANSSREKRDKKGKIIQRRYYGSDGKAIVNIDYDHDGLLLPTEVLLEADSRNRIFFGFDEVWFFPNKSIQPKPPSVSLVGPARLNQARLNKLGKWMEDNSCSLALGGGEGLNFAVRAHGLVRFLLGCSIEQPEPDLASV